MLAPTALGNLDLRGKCSLQVKVLFFQPHAPWLSLLVSVHGVPDAARRALERPSASLARLQLSSEPGATQQPAPPGHAQFFPSSLLSSPVVLRFQIHHPRFQLPPILGAERPAPGTHTFAEDTAVSSPPVSIPWPSARLASGSAGSTRNCRSGWPRRRRVSSRQRASGTGGGMRPAVLLRWRTPTSQASWGKEGWTHPTPGVKGLGRVTQEPTACLDGSAHSGAISVLSFFSRLQGNARDGIWVYFGHDVLRTLQEECGQNCVCTKGLH